MILSDREIELALDGNLFVIAPRPRVEHMDSTTVDLTLSAMLDKWEFPDHNPALGQAPHKGASNESL